MRRAGVAVRKFARILSLLRSELPNQSDTRNSNDSSVPLNPKFAKVLAEYACELRVRDTRPASVRPTGRERRAPMKFAKFLLAACALAAASPLMADDWPSRPVKALTTTSAGGLDRKSTRLNSS